MHKMAAEESWFPDVDNGPVHREPNLKFHDTVLTLCTFFLFCSFPFSPKFSSVLSSLLSVFSCLSLFLSFVLFSPVLFSSLYFIFTFLSFFLFIIYMGFSILRTPILMACHAIGFQAAVHHNYFLYLWLVEVKKKTNLEGKIPTTLYCTEFKDEYGSESQSWSKLDIYSKLRLPAFS